MQKADAKKRPGYGKNEFNGYVNIHINDKDAKTIKATEVKADDLLDFINSRVYDGYNFTQKYDEENGAFRITCMCKSEKSPNFGYILSSWGSTLLDAFKVLRYKWEAKCPDGDWTVWLNENQEFG